MLVIHATKKLLDRAKAAQRHIDKDSTTALGPWYATVLFWRPQVALFVNERTLLPVLVPLAPALSVADRLGPALAEVLTAHGASTAFVESELSEMTEWRLAKTANRSVVGIMNEFGFLAEPFTDRSGEPSLLSLSLRLAETPCGPLYKRHGSPDRELTVLLAEIDARRTGA